MFTCQPSNASRTLLLVLWILAIGVADSPSFADDSDTKPSKSPRRQKSEAVVATEKGKDKESKDDNRDKSDTARTLQYQLQDAPVVYRFVLTNRIGKGFTRKIEGDIAYTIQARPQTSPFGRDEDAMMIGYRGILDTSLPRGAQTELPLFQLGNFAEFHGEVGGYAELMPGGKVVRAEMQGRGIDGLPWGFANFPFLELPAAGVREWTTKNEYTLLRAGRNNLFLSANDGQQLQRPGLVIGFGGNAPGARVAVKPGTLTLAYMQSKQSDAETVFEESIEFDGSSFEPTITLSGSGVIRFDNKAGLVRSIERKMTVKFKDDANETSYPVEIKLTRLEGAALEAYQKEAKERAEETQKRIAEYKAKMELVPSQEDREAVIKVIESGDDSAIETLITKFRSDQSLKEDAELGKMLYKRLGKMQNVPYSASDVFKTLAPDLFQSASIARDYNSSFDIGLTGKELKEDTKLVKGQIVCYPYYSRWQAGEFYAAAEDVVVLYTKGHERKLVVFLRSECRLPAPQFIDPTSLEDEAHAKETPED